MEMAIQAPVAVPPPPSISSHLTPHERVRVVRVLTCIFEESPDLCGRSGGEGGDMDGIPQLPALMRVVCEHLNGQLLTMASLRVCLELDSRVASGHGSRDQRQVDIAVLEAAWEEAMDCLSFLSAVSSVRGVPVRPNQVRCVS